MDTVLIACRQRGESTAIKDLTPTFVELYPQDLYKRVFTELVHNHDRVYRIYRVGAWTGKKKYIGTMRTRLIPNPNYEGRMVSDELIRVAVLEDTRYGGIVNRYGDVKKLED